jgi:hypothetical protein
MEQKAEQPKKLRIDIAHLITLMLIENLYYGHLNDFVLPTAVARTTYVFIANISHGNLARN